MKILRLCIALFIIPFGIYGIREINEVRSIKSLPQLYSESQKICHVHNVMMKEGVVPVTYGSSFQDEKASREAAIKSKLFPNSNTEFSFYDLATHFKSARVLYCQKCREAEKKWKASQK